MFVLREVFSDRERKILREDGDARVPGRALAEVPIPVVAGELDGLLLKGSVVDLGLVEADDVRPALLQVVLQLLLVQHRTDAVHVPGTDQQLARGLAVAVLPQASVVLGLVGGGLVELL